MIGRLGAHRESGQLVLDPWDGERFLGKYVGGFDVVVLQRYMRREVIAAIAKARLAGQAVLSDLDDWFDGLPRSNRAYFTTHPNVVERASGKILLDTGRSPKPHEVAAHIRACEGCAEAAEDNREHFRAITLACDAVLASTAFLQQRYEAMGARAFLVRNSIDVQRWKVQPVRPGPAKTIGWYGALGFRSHGDLRILREVVPRWLRGDPERRFIYGGASNPRDARRLIELLGLYGVQRQVEIRRGVEIRDLQQLLAGVDIGLVPLELNDFNAGKSWLKGAEWAAAGVPFVASPTGEYKALGVGLLAATTQEWMSALERLSDPVARELEAERGRLRAEETSIDRTWRQWEAALREVRADVLVRT